MLSPYDQIKKFKELSFQTGAFSVGLVQTAVKLQYNVAKRIEIMFRVLMLLSFKKSVKCNNYKNKNPAYL